MKSVKLLGWLLVVAPTFLGGSNLPHPVFTEGGLVESYSGNPNHLVLHQGQVAFLGETTEGVNPRRLALSDGKTVEVLATFETPYPALSSARFTAFQGLASDGTDLYLIGSSEDAFEGRSGLFRYRDGFSTLVADAGTLDPGDGFAALGGLRAGGGKLALTVQGAVVRRHLFYNGSDFETVAVEGQAVEEGNGVLEELPLDGMALSRNGAHVAFRARTGDGFDDFTIYRYAGGALQKVATVGDTYGDNIVIERIDDPALVVLNDGSIVFTPAVNTGSPFLDRRLVIADPEKGLSDLPRPVINGTATGPVFLERLAHDGIHFYGRAGFQPLGQAFQTTVVRATIRGEFAEVIRIPFVWEDRSWGGSLQFSLADASESGVLLTLTDETERQGLFTNDRGLGNPPPEPVSVWAGDPRYAGGWKWSTSLGWVHDVNYPFVYSTAFEGWLYVFPGSAGRDGFYFYAYRDGGWLWTREGLQGWVYRFGSGGMEPGWIQLFDN